uniref:Uncharacterized protein n=1 Tax=Arundo donax TaxID=35708 RepID=A0A0A9FUK8_ARUDO
MPPNSFFCSLFAGNSQERPCCPAL